MLKKITQGGVIILLLLISGCASSPSTNFYMLEALSQQASVTGTAKKRQIGIGPISLPALLEHKQIVTRAEEGRVQLAEFHQWAEPLKDNVAQVLTQNLAKLQPGDIFRIYPWSAYGTVDYRVIIDVIRFDSRLGKLVKLEATWSIMDEKIHAIVTNGRSEIEHPLIDASYPATVNALSQLLCELSKDISQAIAVSLN